MLGLAVGSQFLETVSTDGLLQGTHDRTLRNPTARGVSGGACTGPGKEQPEGENQPQQC